MICAESLMLRFALSSKKPNPSMFRTVKPCKESQQRAAPLYCLRLY